MKDVVYLEFKEIDIQEALLMSYQDYVQYLLNKYGPSQYDYFCNENCKSKNSKLSRSKEGLFCHHIAENKEILLSNPEVARTHPFEYQQAHNLVYANYLEHLLLHIKIVEEDVEQKGLGLGGVIMICSVINDFYRNGRADGWRKHAAVHLKGKYNCYIYIMKYFYAFATSNDQLRRMLASPVLSQGWYGQVNRRVHKDIYGSWFGGNIKWSNADLLAYLEHQHKR
jgi:hypothetical protein